MARLVILKAAQFARYKVNMQLTEKEVTEVSMEYCWFEGEGTYRITQFRSVEMMTVFVRECIKLNDLIIASQATPSTPVATIKEQ